MRVDFPEPFSPTRKVTFGWKARLSVRRTTGTLNG